MEKKNSDTGLEGTQLVLSLHSNSKKIKIIRGKEKGKKVRT